MVPKGLNIQFDTFFKREHHHTFAPFQGLYQCVTFLVCVAPSIYWAVLSLPCVWLPFIVSASLKLQVSVEKRRRNDTKRIIAPCCLTCLPATALRCVRPRRLVCVGLCGYLSLTPPPPLLATGSVGPLWVTPFPSQRLPPGHRGASQEAVPEDAEKVAATRQPKLGNGKEERAGKAAEQTKSPRPLRAVESTRLLPARSHPWDN